MSDCISHCDWPTGIGVPISTDSSRQRHVSEPARAQDILEREQLDGLIAQTPINFYYLSDYWGIFNTAGGYDGAYLAVLPRDDREAAGLIVPALEIRRLETTPGTWMPNVFAHSSPEPEAARTLPDGTPQGSDYHG